MLSLHALCTVYMHALCVYVVTTVLSKIVVTVWYVVWYQYGYLWDLRDGVVIPAVTSSVARGDH